MKIEYVCVKTFKVLGFLQRIQRIFGVKGNYTNPFGLKGYYPDWNKTLKFKKGVVYRLRFADCENSDIKFINIYDTEHRLGAFYSDDPVFKNFEPYKAWYRDKQIDSILED